LRFIPRWISGFVHLSHDYIAFLVMKGNDLSSPVQSISPSKR
jgi:hypothetical protein